MTTRRSRTAIAAAAAALAIVARSDGGSEAPDAAPPDAAGASALCYPSADPGPYPAPNAWEPNNGPGAPTVTFASDEIGVTCAYLDGGDFDTTDHHNLVVMYDGYLPMPWAPEFGSRGGVTLWDISEPCARVVRGSGISMTMRETHSIGFA